MAWVNDFFYKESKSKKRKTNIFCFLCWGGEGVVVSDFFLQRIEIYTIFFFVCVCVGGGGWNGRGIVARVSEFFLQIIQI